MIYHGIFVDFEDVVEFECDLSERRDVVESAFMPKITYQFMREDAPIDYISIRYKIWRLDKYETELRRMINNRNDLLYYRRTE